MDTNNIQIKDLRPGLKNVNVVFIVLEVGPLTYTKENREVRSFKVADATACINTTVWDEAGQYLMPGDIVRLTKGYLNIWRNCLTLYTSKAGDIQKIGEFCMIFNEQHNVSEPNLFTQLPQGGPPIPQQNNLALNNGTNNGAGRVGPVAPVTTAPVTQHNNVLSGSKTISSNNVSRSTSSAAGSSNSANDAKRQRGLRGGQHRSRHSRT